MQRHRSLPSLSGRGRARHAAAPATDAAAASTTAGATITLQGADGASLAGHTFDVYRIGTYTDQILNGTRISSLGVRGDTASNAWAADAIGIANAYDPSTADDIGKVYGYDDAGNIANIKMDSQTRQLRNISKALSQSSKKPAAIQGGANLTTTQSTLTINVPAEGLYYITDSAGNPIMIGTKSGNANIMKNDAKDPQWRTLGVAVVKAKSVRVDKKVQVQRNGTTVGKDGTTNDPVGVTVGDTVTNTVEVTVPNKQAASAVKFKLVDQPKGQTYVKGSLSVRLKNAPQTDITADAVIYDGTTQNNAKSIPGDPALKTADNRPADPDLAIPAGGWGIDGRNILDKYSKKMGSQKTVTRMTISTMFSITPTRFPGLSMSFLNRWTPMQTSRIMNANPVSRKNQYQGFPAVAKARSIRDPFMTSYWECSQCL